MENSGGSAPSSAAPVESSAPVADAAVVPGSEPITPPEVKATTASMKKLLKLKVDGQEISEEIDLSDEAALVKHLQMSKTAQKRMQEAAMTRKEAEQFINQLKTDPFAVLTNPKLGVNAREAAERYLAAQLEDEMMSPQERRVRDNERRLREYENREKSQKEAQEREQVGKLQAHYQEQYDKTISKALSESGLPKTTKTVKRMAELMATNLKMGLELEPRQMVELVREDYLTEMKDLLGSSDGDILLKLLGDDTANKIRKADLARLKGTGVQVSKSKRPFREESPSASKKMTPDEWRAHLDKKFTK